MDSWPSMMKTAVAASYMGRPSASAFRRWAKKYDDFPVKIDGYYDREQLDDWRRQLFGNMTGSRKTPSRRALDEMYGVE